MLADSLGYYHVAWWFVLFPGVALLITTLAFNLLGDSVRDAFDPRGERALQAGRRWRASWFAGSLLGLVVLWVIATLVFVMFFVAPQRRRAPDRRPAGDARDGRARRAPPRPRPSGASTSTASYLWNLLHGDLGYSLLQLELGDRSLIVAARCRSPPRSRSGAAVLWLVIGVSARACSRRPAALARPIGS